MARNIVQSREYCVSVPCFQSPSSPSADIYTVTAQPLSPHGITYHTLITIIAGIAAILCIIVSLSLSLGHLLNWVNPQEQKQ